VETALVAKLLELAAQVVKYDTGIVGGAHPGMAHLGWVRSWPWSARTYRNIVT